MSKEIKTWVSDERRAYYNISSMVPTNNVDHEFLAHICPIEKFIQITIYGCQSKEMQNQVICTNVGYFIADIPKIFDSKIKAIILQVFEFKSDEYPNNVLFCQSMKTKFDACKMPYYFMSNLDSMLTKALTATNIISKIDDTVLVIYTDSEWMHELVYTKNGYKGGRRIESDLFKMMDDMVFPVVVHKFNPQKVIITAGKNHQRFMNILKPFNPVFIDVVKPEYDGKCLAEVMKWMLDNNYTKFHVMPTTARIYSLGHQFGETEYGYASAGHFVPLPLEESSVFSKLTNITHFMGYFDPETKKAVRLNEFKLPELAHQYTITLKIDINNFPTYEVKNVLLEQVINLPKLCNTYKADGINLKNYPVIGILANRSFICLCKNEKFEFLESWGGQWGTPTQIVFNNKKPQFGKVAEEILAKYGKYGVQDLLQIMAETPETINSITPHGYTFTENEQHPVLIEFEAFNGEKRAAPPEFLVAMLLREHVKAITAEIGEKPTSLGFCILNDFTETENKNIRKSLETACDLIKIAERCFISWK